MHSGDDDFKSDDFYIEKIKKLRKEKNAVILAHNYQRSEVQDLADFVGDSLGLSQKAASTNADVIVFCGVHFMAETAAVLAPEKIVLLPDMQAGCPMADMITVEGLIEKKKEHPGAVVVCYVNSSAGIKAESDICCTSSNAVKVIESIDKDKKIIFVPDKHLGRFAASKTGREIIYWDGYCPTHLRMTTNDMLDAQKKHPEAKTLVHPECDLEIIGLADEALSTAGITKYVDKSMDREFIIGTEFGLIHRLEKNNPDKKFYLASQKLICPNMKLTTLDKIADVLENMTNRITVSEEIRNKAVKSLDRMLALSSCTVKYQNA